MNGPAGSTLTAARIAVAALLLLSLGGLDGGRLPAAGLAVLLLLLHLPTLSARGRLAGAVRRHGFAVSLALVALGGLAFRLLDIGHGLWHVPTDIDEHRLADSVLHFFRTGAIDHETVEHYPGLHFWLLTGSFLLTYLWHLMAGLISSLDQMPQDPFVLAGRVTNAVLDTGVIVLTGAIGRMVSRPAAGLLAAGIVALSPLALEVSTQLRNEAGLVLLVAATVAASLAASRRPAATTMLLAGALAGCAAAVKYSGVFALLPVLVTMIASPSRWRACGLAVAGFAATLAVTNHYLWADFPNFVRQLATEVTMTGETHWAAQANPRWFFVERLGNWGVGWPILFLAAAATARALASRRLDAWILLAFPLPYVWFMTQQEAQFVRWVYPVVPFVALAGSVGLVALQSALDKRLTSAHGSHSRVQQAVALGVVVAAAAPLVSLAATQLSRRLTTPTHARAEAWLLEHAAPGDRIMSERYWLSFGDADVEIDRVDNLPAVLAGGYHRLFASHWIVVPEPYFGDRSLDRLSLAAEFTADQGFGGHRGIDFRIYTPRPAGLVLLADVALGTPEAAPFLGPEWRPGNDGLPGLALPPGGGTLYVPAPTGENVRLSVTVRHAGETPVMLSSLTVRVNGEEVDLEAVPAEAGAVRLLSPSLSREVVGTRVAVVRVEPAPGAALRVLSISFRQAP